MKSEYVHQDDIFLVGKRILLTTSLQENHLLIKNFWKQFNAKLKSVHMPLAQSWIKYGIMLREDTKLYYFCGVPPT